MSQQITINEELLKGGFELIRSYQHDELCYCGHTTMCDCGEEPKPPTKIGQTCVVPDCKKEAIQGAFHGLCSQHIWPNG